MSFYFEFVANVRAQMGSKLELYYRFSLTVLNLQYATSIY